MALQPTAAAPAQANSPQPPSTSEAGSPNLTPPLELAPVDTDLPDENGTRILNGVPTGVVDTSINPEPVMEDDPASPTGKSYVYYRGNGQEHRREPVPALVNQAGVASVSAPDTVKAPPAPNPAVPPNVPQPSTKSSAKPAAAPLSEVAPIPPTT